MFPTKESTKFLNFLQKGLELSFLYQGLISNKGHYMCYKLNATLTAIQNSELGTYALLFNAWGKLHILKKAQLKTRNSPQNLHSAWRAC